MRRISGEGKAIIKSAENPDNALEIPAEGCTRNLFFPRTFGDYPVRLDFMMDAPRRANAQGAATIIYNEPCDLHGGDNVRLRMDLEKERRSVLVLEKEYGEGAGIGRIKAGGRTFLGITGGDVRCRSSSRSSAA